MTRARSQIVDPSAPGFYHCMSRCVRRAWLCGVDPYSKQSFEHRRQWVEHRLLELADIFAVALHAYAGANSGTPIICDEATSKASTSPTAAVTRRPYRGDMTRARSQIIDPSAPGFYHCVSRCVRRAWLCGLDSYSKQSFEHRREWVEDRLLELADIFAVALHAYAVMSNHLYVVLQIDPGAPGQWRNSGMAQLRDTRNSGTPTICDEAASKPSTSPTAAVTRRSYRGDMTRARSQIVDSSAPGFYHCVSRCVRRAWLCGVDPYSKQSFEHRRQWVEHRLLELADIFAVALHAYAVMSNHLHVVLQIDPSAPGMWTDDEVAERWVRLFPVTSNGTIDPAACALKRSALLGNADRLAQCRERLGDLGWFMRALNEPIARRANAEDGCSGRFWEGRYKCQALLDNAAVLACMSYVDLNPVRAGMAQNLADSTHTSAAARVARLGVDAAHAATELEPVRTSIRGTRMPLRTDQYLDLLDWTGRQLRSDKAGAISADTPHVLDQLGIRSRMWSLQVRGIENRYWRAVGCADALLAKAQDIGQRWMKGIGSARVLERAT